MLTLGGVPDAATKARGILEFETALAKVQWPLEKRRDAEANAIALQIENIQTPRPMTHDLLRNIIQDLNATVDKIVVCDLKENTFYAMFHLTTAHGPVAIDARPSDAIALALRTRAPILVDETVIDHAKTVDMSNEKQDSDRLQQWLEQLDPDDMGKYKM